IEQKAEENWPRGYLDRRYCACEQCHRRHAQPETFRPGLRTSRGELVGLTWVMGQKSAIEWTEATWNPITWCDKISPGCANCYAERMSLRLKLMGQKNYRNGFELTLHEHALELPLKWKTPQRIFVNSMSDLFHKDVPTEFIQKVFATMRTASWHRFEMLTKRSERLAELSAAIEWPPNVWQGVSVESADYTFRVDHLRSTGAKVRFLSIEPLLGPIPQLDLTKIHWVIVGGESG